MISVMGETITKETSLQGNLARGVHCHNMICMIHV